MRRIMTVTLAVLAAGALLASPVLAKRAARHHAATCKQVKDGIAAGKSAEDVAKDLKVSQARVKACTTQRTSAKKSKKAAKAG
ncbi:MAG: hypothetical protein U0807_04790 [Candidatus Binatia bacterium]